LTLVLEGWSFLSLLGRVNCGLLPLVKRIPSDKPQFRTSDVTIPIGRLFRGGWRRSSCSCSANPRLAISVRLLQAGDVYPPKFDWQERVTVARSRVLRIRPESLRYWFHPRFPFAYRNLRTNANSGQVVEDRRLEDGFQVSCEVTWDVRV
jgi:hypothetical protein